MLQVRVADRCKACRTGARVGEPFGSPAATARKRIEGWASLTLGLQDPATRRAAPEA